MPTNLYNKNTQWYRLTDEKGVMRLILTGSYTLATLANHIQPLITEFSDYAQRPELHWDLTEITQIDSAGIALLNQAWNRKYPAYIEWRPEQQRLFNQFSELSVPSAQTKVIDVLQPIIVLGERVLLFWSHVVDIVVLIGQLFLDIKFLIFQPGYIPWREISANLFRAGAQALGITALVGFLIGIVLGYLSSKQLQMFGADLFIINILGISVIRELGPVLAAILVAGRSGSAMTAQLGVMRVTEELDALTVMGISHSQRLVLPKVLGLGIAMPLLVVWTSAISLLGGMIAADIQLGISYQYFIMALPDSVPVENLWLGLGKGVICGMVIALVACHFGLRIKPNTESLGAGTTLSVVTAITVVIMIDAVFAVIFSDVGLSLM